MCYLLNQGTSTHELNQLCAPEVLFESLFVDTTCLAWLILQRWRVQGNRNGARMCFRKRSLYQLYNTGFIAELRVTKTMLVVCMAE